MSETANTAIAVIGIDIGKNSFHVVGHDARGAIVLCKTAHRQLGETTCNARPDHTFGSKCEILGKSR
jgi:hypothetical protein